MFEANLNLDYLIYKLNLLEFIWNFFRVYLECGNDCFLKFFFILKYIKIIFFKKKLFLISSHQNIN
jgi:hypothetical protein